MAKWSRHALEVAAKRFLTKNLDELEEIYQLARKPGKKEKKIIKENSSFHAPVYLQNKFNGRYCRVSRSGGIVFVVGAPKKLKDPETIITLYELNTKKEKKL